MLSNWCVRVKPLIARTPDAGMPDSESPVTFRQILKNRQFFALWLAQFVSNFGDWLALAITLMT